MAVWKPLPRETPLDNVSGLKPKGVTTRAQLNEVEARNIRKAVMHYLLAKPSRRQAFFTLDWCYKLHRQMFGEVWRWAGQNRTTELNLGVPPHRIDVDLQNLLDDLAYWRDKGEMDTLEQVARLHHRAVRSIYSRSLSLREVRIEIAQKGFRLRRLRLVTTLRDHQQYPKEDLAAVYRARWQAELDLRSIKQVMQMDVLRCKSPAMVRKEIWMHLLTYNLVRKLLAAAAATANISPQQVSFKGTLQTLLAFAAIGTFDTARNRRQL